MNLCTSTLPGFTFQQSLNIAKESGCSGIELRIADKYHVSLDDALINGARIKRAVESHGLEISVLNSYLSVEDIDSVDKLIQAAKTLNVPQVRVVLPRAAQAAVAQQARINEGIPAYHSHFHPADIIQRLKACLARLEKRAKQAGVQVLLELHWGTVMSSFTSAYLLVNDLDPKWIGITFDPANMLVEGKEDWEFGLCLLEKHIANVHVKNVVWRHSTEGWTWCWASLDMGMIVWSDLVRLLNQINYQGNYAIEDFLIPQDTKENAIKHITDMRERMEEMLVEPYSEIPRFYGDAFSSTSQH